jgi:hypothetical protein
MIKMSWQSILKEKEQAKLPPELIDSATTQSEVTAEKWFKKPIGKKPKPAEADPNTTQTSLTDYSSKTDEEHFDKNLAAAGKVGAAVLSNRVEER